MEGRRTWDEKGGRGGEAGSVHGHSRKKGAGGEVLGGGACVPHDSTHDVKAWGTEACGPCMLEPMSRADESS